MAKKSAPLSLEELLEGQKQMLTASNLTEEQRKRAEDQIAKLEELRAATTKTQDIQQEVLDQSRVMTKAKGDSKNVTLGDVRTELKELRKDIKADPNRRPLPRPKSDDIIDVDVKEVSGKKDDKERIQKLTDIGATLGEKAELYQKGAGKETTVAKNTETFQRFVAETKRKDELLKDATDDQIKLFERLEDTLIKLRDSDAKDSAELRKELAKIAGELETTDDTAAKKSVSGVLENARDRARVGQRGDKGTLGDAWSALTGKQKVLKEGYEFDPRLKGEGVRRTTENEFGKAGQMPASKKGEVFSMGRVAGAAKIAGNFFRGKIEDYNATNASNAGSNFLDRNFGGNRLEEDRARLGARAEALINNRGTASRSQVTPMATPAGRGGAGTMNITATAVNVRGPIKLTGSQGSNWSAGNAGANAGKDWPPKSTAVVAAAPAAAAAAAPKEEGPGIGSTLMDLGGDLLSRGKGLGGRVAGVGKGILNAGKNLLGKVPGGVLKGGIAGIAGLGLSYGGDKLKEAGYEKTGAAADIAGQAASWGGTGAMIGSVIPGVGTAIGAGVGAVAGGAYGLYKNWGSLFGGKKSENGQATVTPQSNAAQPAVANPSAATKATMIADEPVVPGQALSEKQMATIGMSKSMGNSYSADVEKQYQQQLAKSSVTPAAPTGTANKNVAIENLSKNNAAAKEGNNKPIVINNSQPAPAAPAPAPSIMMPRGQVRSSESAMERYSSRNAHFY
jgi:hypothetical protein